MLFINVQAAPLCSESTQPVLHSTLFWVHGATGSLADEKCVTWSAREAKLCGNHLVSFTLNSHVISCNICQWCDLKAKYFSTASMFI